jgi:thiol-disulfide isomerase/thioredoxin
MGLKTASPTLNTMDKVLTLAVASTLACQSLPMKTDLIVTAADSWIQKPTTIKALRGKVVLLDFWDYTCINCKRTHPYLKEWHRRYHSKGLEIITIHTPEFEFAKTSANVRAAVLREGFQWHVLNDPKKLNWYQFGIFAWPQRILIDPKGFKKLNHIGEGNYGNMEKAIQEDIKKLNPGIKLPPIMEPVRATDVPGVVCRPVTPEIYTWIKGLPNGHLDHKASDIGSTKAFSYPTVIQNNVVYLSGLWFTAKHHLESKSTTSSLKLRYMAKEVNVVVESGVPIEIEVLHDGKPVDGRDLGDDTKNVNGRTWLKTNGSRMYSILKNRDWSNRVVELRVSTPGLRFHSFSFATDCLPGR